jgi:hypothetical protein
MALQNGCQVDVVGPRRSGLVAGNSEGNCGCRARTRHWVVVFTYALAVVRW